MEANLDLNDRCRHRIEEVGQWLESLPEDVAEMEVETSHEAYSTWLTIRPLLNPHAAIVHVGVSGDMFDIHTGHRSLTYYKCTEDSAADYVQAVVTGGLTDVEWLWKGQRVKVRKELHIKGEVERETWREGCSPGPWRWFSRRWEKQVTRYPAYYDLVPSQSHPSESVMIVPPILAWEGLDLGSFPNVRSAEGYIEAYDVDEYVIYDSQGRLLKAITGDMNKGEFWVKLECVEPEPIHASELRQRLLDYQAYFGVSDEWLSSASLEQLVAKALEYSWR